MNHHTEITAIPKAMTGIPCIKSTRGMPRWRAAQREMPVADKIELIGRFVRETRQLETLEKIMQEVCDVLEHLVREGTLTHYAIGGATAAGFHGEPLATRDVDVFVFIEAKPGQLLVSLDPIYTKLNELGFREFEEEGILIHGLPLQFLVASPGLETEAVETAMLVEWDHHRTRIMRPEHLAAIALSVGRPKDRARLVYLCELPDFDHAAFRDILNRHQLSIQWQQWATALGLPPDS